MTTETSKPQASRRIPRRIGAVLAGMLLIIILDTALDVIRPATGIYPPWVPGLAARCEKDRYEDR